MCLATRCNANSCVNFIIATHAISYRNFTIKDELLINFWHKIYAMGYFSMGVISSGSMSLATRCNANSCVIFIIITHIMSCPSFSITDKPLTNLWIKICVQGNLSKSPQGVTYF